MSAIPPDQRVPFLGTFSNMRFTAEHQYGFRVDVWKAGDSLIGRFLCSQGLAGDTPIGMLEKVAYDKKSGAIEFQSRLSMGAHYCAEHKGIASRNLFQFKGRTRKDALTGVIRELDGLHDNRLVRSEEVKLKYSKSEHPLDTGPTTYAEWEDETRRLLESRGPRW